MAETKTMINSIDRVSVVISDKQKSPIRCIFQDNRVLMSAKTANGEAKDICSITGTETIWRSALTTATCWRPSSTLRRIPSALS